MRHCPWLLLPLISCAPSEGDLASVTAELSASARRARAERIRDVTAMNGLRVGALLGGIGDAETGLAHCWSEATWACQGPDAADCAGPVIAGAGDGPCSLRQGGLGMFQFDGGTFEQTLARDGAEILSLDGNIAHAIDFVLAMVVRSQFIAGIDDEAQALAWLNQVPIQPGDARYESWIDTVVRHYNGCAPTSSCWAPRRARYESLTRGIFDEMGGSGFWETPGMPPPPPPPPPRCEVIPRDGRTVEETDPCYAGGGAQSGWRSEASGSAGQMRWTYATAAAEDNFGEWTLTFAEGGRYRIEAHTGGPFSRSRQAPYRIDRPTGSELVIVDQAAVEGLQVIAEIDALAGETTTVHLSDATGEPYADRVPIGFDALVIRRIDAAVPPPPPVVEPARPEPPQITLGEPRAIEPEPVAPMRGEGAGGGCRCTRPGPPSTLVMVALALAVTSRRRRRERR